MEEIKNIFKKNYIKILIGSITAILISGIAFFIYASILCNTNISENTIPSVVLVISFLSIFIGSMISSRKIRKNGIINGTMVGTIYISTIYILSSIFAVGFQINNYSLFMIIGAVISGMLGGVIGVNI